LAAYDFSTFGRVVDVGGGYSQLLGTILRAVPQAHGVLFDLPAVVEGARGRLAAAGVVDRCELVGGDFFAESVPAGGDVYLLQRTILGFDDAQSVRLLDNCRRAMPASSRLLVIEQVLPPAGSTPATEGFFDAAMSDLNMAVVLPGRERTAAEYRALLEAAGLLLRNVVGTQSLMSILEAAPA
jgi:hypothetical protein